MASAVEHKVRKSVRYWDDAYCHTVLNHAACVVATHDPSLLGSTEFALHYHLVLFLSFFFLFSPPLSVEICFRRWFFLSQSPHPSISRCSVHKACGLLRPKRARPSNPIWKLWLVVVNFPCQSFSLHFWFGYRDTIDCFLYVVIEIKYTSSTSLDVAETQTQCTWPAPASLATRAMVNG